MADKERYPAIADYALIADSNSTALVSRAGSIDWCCIPRLDAGSCFGRLLDWEKGGFCSIAPKGGIGNYSRRYLEDTLVLETTFEAEGGAARLIDCYVLPSDPRACYELGRKSHRNADSTVGLVPSRSTFPAFLSRY